MFSDLIALKDIFDVLLVALLMYGVYKLMKNSGAISIFIGVLSFIVLWVLVEFVFHLQLFGSILNKVVDVGAIALIILFQNEIRQFLIMIGSRKHWNNFVSFFSHGDSSYTATYIKQIAISCQHMSETKTGALIVVERNASLSQFAATGERLDALVSSRLIENVFFKNTPLHDGALIIANGKLEAAACVLPVSGNQDIPKAYGLRHRAALGIAEQTDAVAIVVSEETGHIAIANNGTITGSHSHLDIEEVLSGILIKSKKTKQNKPKIQ